MSLSTIKILNLLCLITLFILLFVLLRSDNEMRNVYFNSVRGDVSGATGDSVTSDLLKTSPGESYRRLPNALIVGCAKCGTRALITFLELHPDIKCARREQHFFDVNETYENGLEWYRKQMPERTRDEISLEKSPAYFVVDDVAKRVYHMNSSVKIIVVLCEPVRKIVSRYAQYFEKNPDFGSMEYKIYYQGTKKINPEATIVKEGLYARHFKRWLKYFPLSQIMIVDGEVIKTDPVSEIAKVEKFLGVRHYVDNSMVYFNKTKGFYCFHSFRSTTDTCLGDSKGRPHPTIAQDTLDTLTKFYQPYNEELYKVINRKFDWTVPKLS